ncbi:hypothetical protein GCM10009641_85210 [Mycobacterium cookii]|uniref:DUF732 domain-containing protein n=1 Tax=Nocardioides furvisabuli TaxID=375542 RepID=A0ABP5J3T6_9ACTN|nr:hypothetical protein [Nocardioides furvisabuli]
MPEVSRRTPDRRVSRALGVAGLLAVAGLVVFVARPTDSPPPTPAADPPGSSAQPPAAPAQASDEDFCGGFRRLAESQALHVSQGESADPDQLRESADALVGIGVPESMSIAARSGYYTVISGVYESVDDDLAPAAVGAPDEPLDGADAAFSSYLAEFCPP